MRENRSTWEILGSLLGLVILIAVLYAAVGYFRAGTSELDEATRLAGRPITLAETLAGEAGEEAATSAEAITATVDMTSSAAITGGAEVTLTAELTATAATTETTAAEVATAITTTDVLTESVLTATESSTTTTALTATQLTTTTTVVTAATTLSEDGAVLTTTAVVTTTNEPTSTDELTATGELTGTEATTVTNTAPEAPAELAAVFLKAGCIGCHVIPGIPNAVGQIGPNLSNIGVDGATRIEGYSSEEYIRESLLEPNAFIAPECPTGPCLPNLMVQNLGDTLTTEELDAVVAYLASLGTTAQ